MKTKNNNKFIGSFVNEMYAILLGVGIGNILFVEKLDVSNIFEILMGLFITSVILVYWWDWTDFINDNVVTSKREFIIDFSILIILEVLFLFYNEPQNLIIVFIVLAFLDLLWVLNYIIYKSDNFLANSKKWIAEKVFAIFIMIIAWCGLTIFLKETPVLIQGITVIVAFVSVRLISFKQLTQISNYELVMAKESDYDSLCMINNAYLNPDGKESFIISKLDINTVHEKINQNHSFFVLKIEKEENVIGFVELSDSVPKDILDKVVWTSEKERELVLTKNAKYIEKIVTHSDYLKKGIGTAIYRNLFNQLSDYSFYSFVMVSPYNNIGSVRFHKKMNFRIGGTFSSSEYAGFKNYKSLLFCID